MLLSLSQSCHEGNCPFLLIECQACRGVIPLNEKERHSERECPERTLNCKYCKSLFYFPDIKVRELHPAHRRHAAAGPGGEGGSAGCLCCGPSCCAAVVARELWGRPGPGRLLEAAQLLQNCLSLWGAADVLRSSTAGSALFLGRAIGL